MIDPSPAAETVLVRKWNGSGNGRTNGQLHQPCGITIAEPYGEDKEPLVFVTEFGACRIQVTNTHSHHMPSASPNDIRA